MRASGILMPVFSLPSLYGIGCFGKDAYLFVDFLQQAGQRYWQVLPMGPTGYGDSPYQSFSGTAGNPLFIDIELLMFDGLVDFDDCRAYCGSFPESKIDYARVQASRELLLHIAVDRFDRTTPAYIGFCEENATWLDDYAAFMCIKAAQDGAALWEWEPALQDRQSAQVIQFIADNQDALTYHKVVQYLFYAQWFALKKYANEHNVEIIGDIPIYVSRDSSDFWASPALFMLDEAGTPSFVAGCPPDYFSADGQLWGNPLYDWAYHAQTGFAWWKQRLAFNARIFDLVRIDHFRGLHDFWAVPYGESTAVNGSWLAGPDRALIDELRRAMPELRLIAEDLGKQSDGVAALLDYSGFPGMAVLQFAFDGDPTNPYLPYNVKKNTVIYTATHDNATTMEWCQADRAACLCASAYLGADTAEETVTRLIDAALSSVADTAIIPLFDWLLLGADYRINTPSTLGGNWDTRIPHTLINSALADRIRSRTSCFGRERAAIALKTGQKGESQ